MYLRRQTEAVVTVPLGAPLLLPFKAASMERNGNPSFSSIMFNQLMFFFPNNDSMAPPSTCQSEGNLASVLPQAYEISPYNYALYQQAAGILNAGVYTVQSMITHTHTHTHARTHTHTHTHTTHTKQKAIPNTLCNIIQFSYLVPMQGPQLAVNETFTVQITSKSDFIYLSAHLLLSSSQLQL